MRGIKANTCKSELDSEPDRVAELLKIIGVESLNLCFFFYLSGELVLPKQHKTKDEMVIGFPKENDDKRVGMVPAVLPKLKALGVEVLIEKGAGERALFADEDYEQEAALVSREELLAQSDVLISISPVPQAEWSRLKPQAVMISRFAPYFHKEVSERIKAAGLRAFSLDMIPRTTLAQSMDVLSSFASVAGYKAVLLAANYLPRYFPMMITAAGSIKPAKVLVLGAGVAGLQAIATAKRLGAMVEASDTRLAAKEEVESLGGKFILVEGAKDDASAGGYAVEQSEDFLRRQREEVQLRASKSDVIITTAQVRGRKAPLLLPRETVEKMRPGSVIVDLAASTGGNCELTQDRKVITHQGVTIIGNSDLAADLPQDASFLFANNILNFLKLLVQEGALQIDEENEIIKGALIA